MCEEFIPNMILDDEKGFVSDDGNFIPNKYSEEYNYYDTGEFVPEHDTYADLDDECNWSSLDILEIDWDN